MFSPVCADGSRAAACGYVVVVDDVPHLTQPEIQVESSLSLSPFPLCSTRSRPRPDELYCMLVSPLLSCVLDVL